MKTAIVFAIAALLLVSCVPKKDFDALQAEHEALKNELAALTAEVEEYRNGPERTIALIRKAYEEANFIRYFVSAIKAQASRTYTKSVFMDIAALAKALSL